MGTASLRMGIPSRGFLEEILTLDLEIAEFAAVMAADDLLENIRVIGHVVTSADEVLADLQTLGPLGFSLVTGGGGSRADADLMKAFAKGNGGRLN